MFKVVSIRTDEVYIVYAVKEGNGQTMFLLDTGTRTYDCWEWDYSEFYYPWEDKL